MLVFYTVSKATLPAIMQSSHSQIRNKIECHEDYEYMYVFDHFGQSFEYKNERKEQIDSISEMERWLNQEVQEKVQNISKGINNCCVLNPYKGTGHVKKEKRNKRSSFHTQSNEIKIKGIVDVVRYCGETNNQPCDYVTFLIYENKNTVQ